MPLRSLIEPLRPVEQAARRVRDVVRYGGQYSRFMRDFVAFRALAARDERVLPLSVSWSDRHPCLHDRTADCDYDCHYTYHTAWAARILAETRPDEHIDVGSLLYFSTLISAFVPVRFFDIRATPIDVAGLDTGAVDLCRLPWPTNSVASLSSMHVVEHVGLGRYGDALQADGDLVAMSQLQRVLAPGGNLLFVVPVGRPRVCYNAHRVYSYEQIEAAFQGLTLRQFALIPDGHPTRLMTDADPTLVAEQSYGCGCFWWTKS